MRNKSNLYKYYVSALKNYIQTKNSKTNVPYLKYNNVANRNSLSNKNGKNISETTKAHPLDYLQIQ